MEQSVYGLSQMYTHQTELGFYFETVRTYHFVKSISFTLPVFCQKRLCPNLSLLFQDIRKKENKVSQIAAPFIADNIKTFLRFTQQNCTMPLLRHKDWTIFTNIVNNEDTVPVKMVNTTMCN